MYVLHVSAFGHLQVLYVIYSSAHALFTNIYIKCYVVIDCCSHPTSTYIGNNFKPTILI
jgi:hypothetical protein